MLLVVANAWDPRGVALRQAWDSAGAGLITPMDLSQAGWSFDPCAPGTGWAIIEGQRTQFKDIEGICALLPAVTESDLPHITALDRSYVAAEMTAFLCAWLTSLPCPKVNPVFPSCLCGPNWRTERWVHEAGRLGLPIRTAARSVSPGHHAPKAGGAAQTVVVAGNQRFGCADPTFARWAALLADAADARLLNVHLGTDDRGAFVLGADVWVDVRRSRVANALLDDLRGMP